VKKGESNCWKKYKNNTLLKFKNYQPSKEQEKYTVNQKEQLSKKSDWK